MENKIDKCSPAYVQTFYNKGIEYHMKLNKILTKYHQIVNYFLQYKRKNYEYIHYSSLYGINILFYLYEYHQTTTENHTITIHLFCYSS